MDERHREAKHLLLATREVAGLVAEAVAQLREEVEGALDASIGVGSLAVDERRHLQVVTHRHRVEDGLPAWELVDPQLHPRFGRGECDRLPVEADHAAAWDGEAGDRAEGGRLACSVGAQKSERLAFRDVEVDVEEHLYPSVGEVDVADLERGNVVGIGDAGGVLGLFLLDLLGDERQVVADEACTVDQEQSADEVCRPSEQDHGPPGAEFVRDQPADDGAPHAADTEDHGDHDGGALGAESVRGHRGENRGDHCELGGADDDADRADDGEESRRRHRHLQR